MRTKAEWTARADYHRELVSGLIDGTVGEYEICVPGMSIGEALAIERRNVLYCVSQSEVQA